MCWHGLWKVESTAGSCVQGTVRFVFGERGGLAGEYRKLSPPAPCPTAVCSSFVLSCPGTAVPMVMCSAARLCTARGKETGWGDVLQQKMEGLNVSPVLCAKAV